MIKLLKVGSALASAKIDGLRPMQSKQFQRNNSFLSLGLGWPIDKGWHDLLQYSSTNSLLTIMKFVAEIFYKPTKLNIYPFSH